MACRRSSESTGEKPSGLRLNPASVEELANGAEPLPLDVWIEVDACQQRVQVFCRVDLQQQPTLD